MNLGRDGQKGEIGGRCQNCHPGEKGVKGEPGLSGIPGLQVLLKQLIVFIYQWFISFQCYDNKKKNENNIKQLNIFL